MLSTTAPARVGEGADFEPDSCDGRLGIDGSELHAVTSSIYTQRAAKRRRRKRVFIVATFSSQSFSWIIQQSAWIETGDGDASYVSLYARNSLHWGDAALGGYAYFRSYIQVSGSYPAPDIIIRFSIHSYYIFNIKIQCKYTPAPSELSMLRKKLKVESWDAGVRSRRKPVILSGAQDLPRNDEEAEGIGENRWREVLSGSTFQCIV
jgi:hypothetical protein